MASQTGSMGVIGSRLTRRPAPRSRSRVMQTIVQKTLTYAQERHGNITTVTVTTNLAGTIYYHWYLDGVWVTATTTNQYSFMPLAGEQARVECIATNDAYFDYVANAPSTPAARVLLWWIRSIDTDVKEYLVEQQQDGGDWSTIATVPYEAGAWDYRLTTPRLDDLSDYAWRVTPIDTVGNAGSATSLTARTIVRTPDSPDFTATFDEGTTKVAFAEAA